MQGVVLVSQRLVLLLLEESSLYLPLRRAQWGSLLNISSPSRQTLSVRKECHCPVKKQPLHPVDHFPIRIQHRPDQQTSDTRLCPSLLVHLRLKVLRPSFHVFLLVGWGDWNSRWMIVQELLSLRQQQAPSCHKNFLGTYCHLLEDIFYTQSHWIWSKVERPLITVVGDWENHVALM